MKAKGMVSMLAVFTTAAVISTCSKSGSPTDPGGGGTTATAAYYGLANGASYKAHYYDYVPADGRLFTVDSTRFDVIATVGANTTYHGSTTIPIQISLLNSGEDTVDAIVYVSIKSDGLYFHGLRTCGNDYALPASMRVAAFPITDSARWFYNDLIPARVTRCLAGLASGRTFDIRLSGPANRTVQGIAYAGVFALQVVYQQDDYEIWFAPNTGIIFGSEFSDTTFTQPTQGFQVFEIN